MPWDRGKKREEDLAVGMRTHGTGDLGVDELYLFDQRAQGGRQREHHGAPSFRLLLARSASRGAPQPLEQFGSLLAATVAMSGEEGTEALLAEAMGVGGTWVALQEGQGDRRVDVGEDRGGPRPERLQLGAQAIGESDSGLDQVLPRTGERPQGPGLVGVGGESAEAMMVGAGEFGQHEGIEGVGLATRGSKARTGGLHLVRMDRQDREARLQKTLDQHAVRTLDRHPFDAVIDQRPAKPIQARFIVGEASLQNEASVSVRDVERVLFFGPIHPGVPAHRRSSLGCVHGGETDQELYHCGCS